MSDTITKNGSFLKFFLTANTLQKKVMLQNVSLQQTKALSEIAVNLLNDTVDLPAQTKMQLKRYKKVYRLIGSRRTSLKNKQNVLRSSYRAITLMLQGFRSHLGL